MTPSSSVIDNYILTENVHGTLYRSKSLLSSKEDGTAGYGGQYVAQSMWAALQTVPRDMFIHNFHSNFIFPGDTSRPVFYRVLALRDGFSVFARQVRAYQEIPVDSTEDTVAGTADVEEQIVFCCQMSFCSAKPDVGVEQLNYQEVMPTVAHADVLEELPEVIGRTLDDGAVVLTDERRHQLESRRDNVESSFHSRPVDAQAAMRLTAHEPTYRIWLKAKENLGDDMRLHHSMVAYMSNAAMVDAALMPHTDQIQSGVEAGGRVDCMSLDYAFWIHEPRLRADRWLLYELHSSKADHCRSLIEGKLFTEDGVLVMSTVQQSMLLVRPRFPSKK